MKIGKIGMTIEDMSDRGEQFARTAALLSMAVRALNRRRARWYGQEQVSLLRALVDTLADQACW